MLILTSIFSISAVNRSLSATSKAVHFLVVLNQQDDFSWIDIAIVFTKGYRYRFAETRINGIDTQFLCHKPQVVAFDKGFDGLFGQAGSGRRVLSLIWR